MTAINTFYNMVSDVLVEPLGLLKLGYPDRFVVQWNCWSQKFLHFAKAINLPVEEKEYQVAVLCCCTNELRRGNEQDGRLHESEMNHLYFNEPYATQNQRWKYGLGRR